MEENQNPAVVPPTVSGTFGLGWERMKRSFPELLLILLVLILFSIPMGLVDFLFEKGSAGHIFFSIFNAAYGLIIMAPLHYGACMLFLKAIRGEGINVNEIFFAYRKTLQIIMANILVMVVVGLGFVMLVVPGIIFACKLSMVPYLMMDKNMEAVEAVRTSWHITKGHSWTIFGMAVLSFFIAIGGVILLIVGIFPAIIWISLAFAAMYNSITKDERRETN